MNEAEKRTRDTQSRRNFLKKTSVVAAAFAAAPGRFVTPVYGQKQAPPPPSVLGANDRLTVGFIGVGNQGFSALLRGVKEDGAEHNVVGVAVNDVWTDRIDRGLAELELPESAGYQDYRRLLERDDIDGVFIGSVDHWHARQSIDAMEAGKHVYIEKPITRYLDEAFQVHEAAIRTGKKVQVGSRHCSDGKWHLASELIQAGKIGPPVLAQDSFMRNRPDGEWNYRIDPALNEHNMDWQQWLGPVPSRPFSADHYFRWRKYYPYCAGILGDLLAHRILPLMIATGNPEFPVRVACLGTRKITTDRDVPDNTQVIAEFPSGLTMLVIGSTVNEHGLGQVVRGHEATIYFSGNRLELRPERPFSDLVDPEEHDNIQPVPSTAVHQADWYTAIRTGSETNGNVDLSVKAQTVISLAEMSERFGEMLHFDESTRKITNGSGREFEPITYATEPMNHVQ